MKRRQFITFSLTLAIALSAFGLFLRSALTPRYSRSEIMIGEMRKHRLIVSYPSDWIVETFFDHSIILSHRKPSNIELSTKRILPWFFHSDWNGIEVIINTQNLDNSKSIDEDITEMKLAESHTPQNGYLLVIKDYRHPLGKGVEQDFSLLPPPKPTDFRWYTHDFGFYCQPDPHKGPVLITVNFHSKASMKGSIDTVVKDILSRMRIEYVP